MGEAKRKPVHRFRTMSGSDVTAAGFARIRTTATSAKQTVNG